MEEEKTVKGVLALKRYLYEQGINVSHPTICRHKDLQRFDFDKYGNIIINQKLMDLFEPLKGREPNGKSGRPNTRGKLLSVTRVKSFVTTISLS